MGFRVRTARRARTPWATIGTVTLTLGLAAAGCSTSGASAPSTTAAVSGTRAFYTPPTPLPAAAPGTLIRSVRVTGVPGVPPGATVWRILFHSTTVYGKDVAESGYVIAPAAPAPAGGYPVIAWAHGTSGFAASCAPSLFAGSGAGLYPVSYTHLTLPTNREV